MKKIITLVLLISNVCLAGELYVRDGYMGEYAATYTATKKVVLRVQNTPFENASYNDIPCYIVKGQKIDLLNDQSLSRSSIINYIATKDIDVLGLKKGETIQELGYLSEGYCKLRKDGKEFDDSCLEFIDGLQAQNEGKVSEQWVKIKCSYANSGWINTNQLSEDNFEYGVNAPWL